jgi:hypothetical protein
MHRFEELMPFEHHQPDQFGEQQQFDRRPEPLPRQIEVFRRERDHDRGEVMAPAAIAIIRLRRAVALEGFSLAIDLCLKQFADRSWLRLLRVLS